MGYKRIIVSEHINLKQLRLSDAQDIFNTIDSQREYLGKWLPFVAFTKELNDTEAFINSVLDSLKDTRDYVYVISYQGQFAGLIGFKGTDNANKKTEIGYWLSMDFQKKGIVTLSVKTLLDFAFNEMGINRVQIKVAQGNIPSRNIPVKLGFTFEGIERQGELLSSGVFADLEVYGILKDE